MAWLEATDAVSGTDAPRPLRAPPLAGVPAAGCLRRRLSLAPPVIESSVSSPADDAVLAAAAVRLRRGLAAVGEVLAVDEGEAIGCSAAAAVSFLARARGALATGAGMGAATDGSERRFWTSGGGGGGNECCGGGPPGYAPSRVAGREPCANAGTECAEEDVGREGSIGYDGGPPDECGGGRGRPPDDVGGSA